MIPAILFEPIITYAPAKVRRERLCVGKTVMLLYPPPPYLPTPCFFALDQVPGLL